MHLALPFYLLALVSLAQETTAFHPGFAAMTGFTSKRTIFFVSDLETGAIVSNITLDYGAIANTPSATIDLDSQFYTVQITPVGGAKQILRFSYNENGTLSNANNCTNTLSGQQCIVYADNKLFALSGVNFRGVNVLSTWDLDTCETSVLFKNLNAGVVRGSSNGPGAQCVALPDIQTIFYMEDKNPILWAINYAKGTNQSFDLSQNYTSAFMDSFGKLLAYPEADLLVYNSYKGTYLVKTDGTSKQSISWSLYNVDIDTISSDGPFLVQASGGSYPRAYTLGGVLKWTGLKKMGEATGYNSFNNFKYIPPNLTNKILG